MIYVNVLFLLIFASLCFAFAFCFFRRTDKKGPDISGELMSGKAVRMILVALICFFVFLRIFRFGDIPGGVNQDEAMAAVDAKALAEYGTDRFGTRLPAHFYAWGYGQMSVLMSYCMVPFIKLFGFSSVTIRLPILIASIMGLGAVFLIVKNLISTDAALIATLLASVNPWHFMQSRWALDCNMFPHMFLIGFMLLVLGIRKKPFIYLSMVFFALCMYSYGVSFYMVPLFLLAAAIALVCLKAVKIRHILISAFVYFLLSFPIYLTMLINAMGRDTISLPFVTMQSFKDCIRTKDMLFFSNAPLTQLISNIRSEIDVLVFQNGTAWNTIPDFGTAYLCSIPFVLLGFGICVYKAFKDEKAEKRAIYLLLVIYAACAVLVGIFINQVNINRINIVHYAGIVFMAVSIYHLISWKKKTAYAVSAVYGLLCVLFFATYFLIWPEPIGRIFYTDFLQSLDYAKTLDFDKCYISPDTQFTGTEDVSEILTLYEYRIDALYFQGKTDSFDGKDISYKDRFVYSNPTEKKPEPDGKVVYIVRSNAYPDYDFSAWEYKEFGEYRVYSARS